jgi:hypothetical protein
MPVRYQAAPRPDFFKFQSPNPNLQINPNHQYPNQFTFLLALSLKFGHWSFGHYLLLEVWNLVILTLK